MTHTAVAIGYLGSQILYIDVPRDEAIARYIRDHNDGEPLGELGERITEFTFKDSLAVYDVWTIE